MSPLYNFADVESIHWEPTDKCNAGCPMCPRYVNNGAAENPNLPNGEMTLAMWKDRIGSQFSSRLRKILACGNYGEPIVCRDFLQIYQYLREHNPSVGLGINTNGSARNKSFWEELGRVVSDNGYLSAPSETYCTFSIDGLSDTNHLYRRKTNYERIIANAEAFISTGGIAHWDFIVFRHNEHQVDEAREVARKMGFKNFNVKKTTRWSSYDERGGYYEVKNSDGSIAYRLEQPKSENFRHENSTTLIEAKDKLSEKLDKPFVGNIYIDPITREKFNLSRLGIACRATKPKNSANEIFITGSNHVFPCCFLGSQPWLAWVNDSKFLTLLEQCGGIDSLSLAHHSLEAIINESSFFTGALVETFQPNHPLRSYQCSYCCGAEWNGLDHGELGDKARSTIE